MARVKLEAGLGIASISGRIGNLVFRVSADGTTYVQQAPAASNTATRRRSSSTISASGLPPATGMPNRPAPKVGLTVLLAATVRQLSVRAWDRPGNEALLIVDL